jgi:EAL domain-containing protein (putative c-di-GMP-specific phosphodiesterase class I)
LLHCAELALGESKRQGRAVTTAYEPALGQRVLQALRVQARLRQALRDGMLSLHYQPQVDIASGGVIGFEALLRWHDPEHGAVSPAEFVPLAERAGLIGELGDFVLRTACAQLRRWLDAGLPARIAVNLSPRQFRHTGLAERIAQELRAQRLPGALLAVEITETAVMDDPAAAAAQLRALQTLGVEVHLDDFGTGHSSLAWLKILPISVIKIDRSFVVGVVDDTDDEAIVGAIVGLAHALDCRVVAEGIEKPEQLELLTALGCDQYQGWLFSKALDAQAASALLRAKGRTIDAPDPRLADAA